MQKPNRIVWMLDETLIKSSPSHWPKIRQQTTNIVQKFGNPDMDHFLADPEPLIKKLGEKLAGKTFSCVIDLSGWMGEVLSPVINSPVITTEFSVSRIREASDPSLPTSGYISSLSRDKRVRLKFNLNRSKTLILDDTSFSGNTSLLTIKELGLNPETTTNGFLISNS
ncbi:MAG: hypothetical protein U9Q63_00995, partial [Patescibacteria group bacterium]|nr:hypothetical protein [Patescibacteria group bacterium]